MAAIEVTSHSHTPSRSHALRGNAGTDALRRESDTMNLLEIHGERNTTQSVGTPVPTLSVGTRIAVCCAVLFIATAPAYADEAKPAEKVTFQDHVLPIFRAKCGM